MSELRVSVSYLARPIAWLPIRRRYFACGNTLISEALVTLEYLERVGRDGIRVTVDRDARDGAAT